MYVTDVAIPAEADTSDLRLACGALLELLHDKLLAAPAAHATRCFLVLLDHLEHHYRRPALFQYHPAVRVKVPPHSDVYNKTLCHTGHTLKSFFGR